MMTGYCTCMCCTVSQKRRAVQRHEWASGQGKGVCACLLQWNPIHATPPGAMWYILTCHHKRWVLVQPSIR